MTTVSEDFVQKTGGSFAPLAAAEETVPEITGDYRRFTRELREVTGEIPGHDASALFYLALKESEKGTDGQCFDLCENVLYNAALRGALAGKKDCLGLCSHIYAYAYARDINILYVNLFLSSRLSMEMEAGGVTLEMNTVYPRKGEIRLTVKECFDCFTLALRLPGWVRTYDLTVNGSHRVTVMDRGYLFLSALRPGDEIVYTLGMEARLLRAHPRRDDLAGKVCVCAGPVVFAAQSSKAGNLLLDAAAFAEADFTQTVPSIHLPAKRIQTAPWDEYELYAAHAHPVYEDAQAEFVPYCLAEENAAVWLRCADK